MSYTVKIFDAENQLISVRYLSNGDEMHTWLSLTRMPQRAYHPANVVRLRWAATTLIGVLSHDQARYPDRHEVYP